MCFNGINFDYEDIIEGESALEQERAEKQQKHCDQCKAVGRKLFSFYYCKDCEEE